MMMGRNGRLRIVSLYGAGTDMEGEMGKEIGG